MVALAVTAPPNAEDAGSRGRHGRRNQPRYRSTPTSMAAATICSAQRPHLRPSTSFPPRYSMNSPQRQLSSATSKRWFCNSHASEPQGFDLHFHQLNIHSGTVTAVADRGWPRRGHCCQTAVDRSCPDCGLRTRANAPGVKSSTRAVVAGLTTVILCVPTAIRDLHLVCGSSHERNVSFRQRCQLLGFRPHSFRCAVPTCEHSGQLFNGASFVPGTVAPLDRGQHGLERPRQTGLRFRSGAHRLIESSFHVFVGRLTGRTDGPQGQPIHVVGIPAFEVGAPFSTAVALGHVTDLATPLTQLDRSRSWLVEVGDRRPKVGIPPQPFRSVSSEFPGRRSMAESESRRLFCPDDNLVGVPVVPDDKRCRCGRAGLGGVPPTAP